jgi:hypothetical protein
VGAGRSARRYVRPAILKTSDAMADSLMPCVSVWPIDKLLANYAEWVGDSVG